jgi:hypothetical protein
LTPGEERVAEGGVGVGVEVDEGGGVKTMECEGWWKGRANMVEKG